MSPTERTFIPGDWVKLEWLITELFSLIITKDVSLAVIDSDVTANTSNIVWMESDIDTNKSDITILKSSLLTAHSHITVGDSDIAYGGSLPSKVVMNQIFVVTGANNTPYFGKVIVAG